MKDGKRAVAVLRVSKSRSAQDDHYSLPAQEAAVCAYCEREGYELVRVFIEPGTSAYVTDIEKIPGLSNAVRMIEAGEGDVLIVHESSRLARTERLTNEVADRLERAGGRFINVTMSGLDYSTPEGRMILSQEAAMNSYWSRKTGQHSRKGKQQQFEQGLHIGQVPFGYTHAVLEVGGVQQATRKLPMVIVPDEAEAIRKAYEDYAMGVNAHQIAREWNELGFKPRSTKGLTYFQPQTVRDILRNPLYKGMVTHLGESIPGKHEPIVTEAQFAAAQRPVGKVNKRVHPPLLLRGIAQCAYGHRVYDLNPRGRKDHYKTHHYYREPSHDFERPCPQATSLWAAGKVDPQVEALLRTLALDRDWLDYVQAEARAGGRDTRKERERLQTRMDRAQQDYWDGRLPREKWDQIYLDCTTGLSALTASETPLDESSLRIMSFWSLWEGASAEVKNETCRLVFESVVLDFHERTVAFKPHPEFEPLLDARSVYVEQERPAPGSQRPCCWAPNSTRCSEWPTAPALGIPGPPYPVGRRLSSSASPNA